VRGIEVRWGDDFRNTSNVEPRFWLSLIESASRARPERAVWYWARLAQFHFTRREYEDVRSCMNKMVESVTDYMVLSEKLNKVLRRLEAGWDAVEFWATAVDARLTSFCIQ
jgi:hypothetical protein